MQDSGIDSSLLQWIKNIDEQAGNLSLASVKEIVNSLTQLIENDKFITFLWERYRYLRGNIYVQFDPEQAPFCLHRSPEGDISFPQIRLPWLRINDDQVTMDEKRDKMEGAISVTNNLETSSKRLATWLRKKSGRVAVVPWGELVFFRLYSPNHPFLPSTEQLSALERWLSSGYAKDIAGELLPNDVDRYLERVKQGFSPSEDEVKTAQELVRFNPILEVDFLNTRNLLFFPVGRYYALLGSREWVDVFCIVSLYDEEKLHLRNEIILLLRRLTHLGVEYSRQAEAVRQAAQNQWLLLFVNVSHSLKAPVSLLEHYINQNKAELQSHYDHITAPLSRLSRVVAHHAKKPIEARREIEGKVISGAEIKRRLEAVIKTVIDYAKQHQSAAKFDPSDAQRSLLNPPVLVEAEADENCVYWHEVIMEDIYLYEDLLNAFRYFDYPAPEATPLPLVCLLRKQDKGSGLELVIANPARSGEELYEEDITGFYGWISWGTDPKALNKFRHIAFNEWYKPYFERKLPKKRELPKYVELKNWHETLVSHYQECYQDVTYYWVKYLLKKQEVTQDDFKGANWEGTNFA